jgi:hypothetical protein
MLERRVRRHPFADYDNHSSHLGTLREKFAITDLPRFGVVLGPPGFFLYVSRGPGEGLKGRTEGDVGGLKGTLFQRCLTLPLSCSMIVVAAIINSGSLSTR